ncbi:MAG: hypothetical protein JWO59_1586 [Chloroflexi bacterium]|nr:hypothetical protein [Chloroflexota bacterium]
MADASLSAEVWDALRQLAYEDGERVAVRSALSHAKERATLDVRLGAARTRLSEAEQAVAHASTARRAIEDQIEDTNLRTKRTEARLASGRLQSEREVQAAQTELENLQATAIQNDEAWLLATSNEDTAKSAVPGLTAALASEERAAADRQAAAEREVADAERRLAAIDAVRRDAAQKLPPDIRDRYRALYPKTGGRPFAEAIAGECSNCHRSVPAASVQMIRAHTGVPSCPSCGRLLLAP